MITNENAYVIVHLSILCTVRVCCRAYELQNDNFLFLWY